MSGDPLEVDDGRHYRNDVKLREPGHLNAKFSDVAGFKDKLVQKISDLLRDLEGRAEQETDRHDGSVYTGTTGIALLYLHLSSVFTQERNDYLHKAETWLKRSQLSRRDRVTFLCGNAGYYAVAAVIYHRLGEAGKVKQCLEQLLSIRQSVLSPDSDLPDEFLYGRAGYLYSLHYVRRELGEDKIPEQYLDQIREVIVGSGRALSREESSPSPLMYEWHGSKYLGAAHGLAGIYYILMMSQNPDTLGLVRQSVDFLLPLQWPSGNCPSSLGRDRDKLVHWCHGAPGWIYMFGRAYEVYKDDRYLRAAELCAECIWTRGLLRKGYGLCHGTAGNGYPFLYMYRLTGKDEYLHMALEFGDWCCSYGQHGCRVADRPYSLFEGMAGTIYYLADLLDPMKARFPAFEVD